MKKYEKQWLELNKRGLHVSLKQFKNFYDISRKAASKMNRLYRNSNDNTLLNNRKVSKGISFIKTDEDFKKAYESRKKIVDKSFIKNDNQKTFNRLKKNLKAAFGNSKKTQALINTLKKMPIKDLKQFMKENRDLEPFLYYLDQELFEKLDLRLEDFTERLKEFDSNLKIGFKGNSGVDSYLPEDMNPKINKPKKKNKKGKRENLYEKSIREHQELFKKQNPDYWNSKNLKKK